MAVTFTQAEIDAFRTFMLTNRGVTQMTIADRHYVFSSLKEMTDYLAYMQRNLASASPPKTRYAQTDNKGLR